MSLRFEIKVKVLGLSFGMSLKKQSFAQLYGEERGPWRTSSRVFKAPRDAQGTWLWSLLR